MFSKNMGNFKGTGNSGVTCKVLGWSVAVVLLLLIIGLITTVNSRHLTVYYRNGTVVMPRRIDQVYKVVQYVHGGEVIQTAIFSGAHEKAIVYNQPDLVEVKKPLLSGIEFSTVHDRTFHSYDPYFQGNKNLAYQEYIREQYQKMMGRLPSDAELYAALDNLTRGVTKAEFEERLQYNPEAALRYLNDLAANQRGMPLSSQQETLVIDMLCRGETLKSIEARILDGVR